MRGNFRKHSREQKRDPASHARSHEYRLALRQSMPADRGGLGKPGADGSVLEPAARPAMAGVIESEASSAVRLGPARKRRRLHAPHFRLEAAEPDEGWLIFFRLSETVRDLDGGYAIGPNREELQFFAVHPMLLR